MTREERFATDLMRHHADDLHRGEEILHAIVLKTVALLVLAYDVPPTTGGIVPSRPCVLCEWPTATELRS
jgi:hypothetical protein